MTSPSDDNWNDMTLWDAEFDRVLSGAMPPPEAPAWCTDVAVLVRTAQAPAQPDEMRREAEIVGRMAELRISLLAGAPGPDDGSAAAAGLEVDLRTTPAVVTDEPGTRRPEPVAADLVAAEPVAPEVTGPEGVAPLRLVPEPGAPRAAADVPAPASPAAVEPDPDETAADPTHRDTVVVAMTGGNGTDDDRDDAYTAKHSGERGYRAKHAAARLEASKYPIARTLGRVIAIKAVAVTTAAVAGVAAAAATTGIVATVVVPAISDSTHRPVAPSTTSTTDPTGDAGRPSAGGRSPVTEPGECTVVVECPASTTVAPGAATTTVPGGTATTVPGSQTATTAPATTSTTASPATTAPEPPPTTTTPTEPTTTVPTDPSTFAATSGP
ncbi:MAG TPA: hypothetical protein VFI47_23795 [Acidimicrobiales bacterium]|nr:hypothetical protein [Acidimicrobiales bacterium]